MNKEAEVWTIQKLIQWTTEHFTKKNISSPRLDSELLLASVLKCARLDLYLKFDQPLKETELKDFKELVLRRAQREPVAYILGQQEFYGRPFAVGPGVLIPRPETEHLVDEAIKWISENQRESIRILDVGSGSGCIGVTLAAEVPEAGVTTIEIADEGIKFTELNALKHQVSERVEIKKLDFEKFLSEFSVLKGTFDLVVSNPPYIGRETQGELQEEVSKYEPAGALFGGERGHEIIEAWLPALVGSLRPGGLLLCEIGFDQGERVLALSKKEERLRDVEILKDYSGHSRILKAYSNEREIHG